VLAAAMLLAAGGIVAGWAVWVAPGPPPAPVVGAASATTALLLATPPRPFVDIEATTRRDRAVLEQAAALLGRQGELADRRRAEIRQRRMNRIDGLFMSACADCIATELVTSTRGNVQAKGYIAVNGRVSDCHAILNMPFVRRQARAWGVPDAQLVAMLMLHEQELCLHGETSTTTPADAERRLARKLRNDRLFDRFYAQVEASSRDRAAVELALALARGQGELAFQRRDVIRRQRHNQVNPLRITVCRSCRTGRIGEATGIEVSTDVVACEIVIDMSGVERNARGWSLPVTDVVSVLLVHEQEHCIRYPDDHERPAVDEEVRLARKLGKVRLLEYTTSSYQQLDSNGYWKRRPARSGRKNARRSSTSSSGTSMAGKWPPRSNRDQCLIRRSGSITRRSRSSPPNWASPCGAGGGPPDDEVQSGPECAPS
jgi:hypothetical protein